MTDGVDGHEEEERDEKKVEVEDVEFSELLIAKPKWFDFELTPREGKRERILEFLGGELEKGSFQEGEELGGGEKGVSG